MGFRELPAIEEGRNGHADETTGPPADGRDAVTSLDPPGNIDTRTEFDDLRVLLRKWRTVPRYDGLPIYEELVLGGLGRIADEVAVVRQLEDGCATLMRAGDAFAAIVECDCHGRPLDRLAHGFQLSIELALKDARRTGAPSLQLCQAAQDGMISTVEIAALPLSSRWEGAFFLLFARARERQIELANLLINSMPEGIMALSALDRKNGAPTDFLILSINEAAARLFGSTPEALRSAQLSSALAGTGFEGCIDKLRDAVSRGNGHAVSLECSANGKSLQIGITATGSILTVTLTDVGVLKARETLFRSMFDDNPVPMVLRDSGGRAVLDVNDAALRLYRYDRTQFLKLEPEALLHGPSDPVVRPLTAVEAGGNPKRHRTADGRVLDVVEYEREIAVGGRPAVLATIIDVTERTRAEAQITFLAHHDPLTGLANRTVFTQTLETALGRIQSGGAGFAVICVDLDGFKLINDTLGHDAGDTLLVNVGRRLQALTRAPDVIARLGGDEFALILQSCAGPEAAAGHADALIEALDQPHWIDGREIRVGASLGIALAPTHTTDLQQILKFADLALYRAKQDSGSAFRFFESQMDRVVGERRQLEMDLRRAVIENEFELSYQPIIAVQTGGLRGFEALVRWNHPTRGSIPPGKFIPLAEEIGVIGDIGEWTLREACREAVTWPDSLIIAVNVSARQFSNGGLVDTVAATIQAFGLPAQRLEVEITESVLLNGTQDNIGILRRLRDLDIRIALDDFGTGYSSMGYLTKFPFNRIKIDRSFVADLEIDSGSRAIVRAIIGLATGFGMDITAEGVETVGQLEVLREERCSELQGFLFSPPMPRDNVRSVIDAYLGSGEVERDAIRQAG